MYVGTAQPAVAVAAAAATHLAEVESNVLEAVAAGSGKWTRESEAGAFE